MDIKQMCYKMKGSAGNMIMNMLIEERKMILHTIIKNIIKIQTEL